MKETRAELTAFETDGHLTEVVLDALADGEDGVVPEAALQHLDDCDHCLARMGVAAEESVRATVAVEALAERYSPQVAPRPLPVAALLGALTIAVLAALPGAAGVAAELPTVEWLSQKGVPLLARAIVALSRVAESALSGPWVPWLTAFLLILGGLVVAKRSPLASRERSL